MATDKVMQAFGLLMSRDYSGAEKAFTNLIERSPDDVELFAKRALARSELGKRTEAVADVRHALSLVTEKKQRKELQEFLDRLEAEAKLLGDGEVGPYETALFTAAEAGQLQKVRKLIKAREDLERGKDARASNRSPLAVAAENGHVEVVAELLAAGAQIDAKVDTNLWDGPRHWTPLLLAANEGHRDVVELLVKKGADLSYVDEVGWGAVRAALKDVDEDGWEKGEKLAEWLVKRGAPLDAKSQAKLKEIAKHKATTTRTKKKA